MAKIKVAQPVVELDGDEMARIMWSFYQKQADLARVSKSTRNTTTSA